MSRLLVLLAALTIIPISHGKARPPECTIYGVADAGWSPSCNPWSPPTCTDCEWDCVDRCADAEEQCTNFQAFACAARCWELTEECCGGIPGCGIHPAERVIDWVLSLSRH